jgi:hypothetical protein
MILAYYIGQDTARAGSISVLVWWPADWLGGWSLGWIERSDRNSAWETSCDYDTKKNFVWCSTVLSSLILTFVRPSTTTTGSHWHVWTSQYPMFFCVETEPLYLHLQLIDKPDGPLGKGYFLGKLIHQDDTVSLTVHGVLEWVLCWFLLRWRVVICSSSSCLWLWISSQVLWSCNQWWW